MSFRSAYPGTCNRPHGSFPPSGQRPGTSHCGKWHRPPDRFQAAGLSAARAEDVVAPANYDAGRRRHARLEQKIRIGRADDDIIGHDVLRRLRRLPDLRHLSSEARFGKDLTVNEALSPSFTSPMSFSPTLASTSMTVRSEAMRKSGVCEPASTVWPNSTLRETTVPSTGETISV